MLTEAESVAVVDDEAEPELKGSMVFVEFERVNGYGGSVSVEELGIAVAV